MVYCATKVLTFALTVRSGYLSINQGNLKELYFWPLLLRVQKEKKKLVLLEDIQ